MNSWMKDLDRARSEAEVVSSARDYCALLHPRDLAALPAECRQIRIESDADIPRLRERLAREYAGLRAHASEMEQLRDLVTFLGHAAERLGELRK